MRAAAIQTRINNVYSQQRTRRPERAGALPLIRRFLRQARCQHSEVEALVVILGILKIAWVVRKWGLQV